MSSDSGHANKGETTFALPAFPASFGTPKRIPRINTESFSGVLQGLYHKQIGLGKALDPFGYGIIARVNSLETFLHSMPSPAQRVLSALAQAQGRYSLFPVAANDRPRPFPVVVGVSGGVDSVCLLHALSLLAEHWNIRLHTAHVDHGLRAESGTDADFVRLFAQALELDFHLRRLDADSLASDERGVEAAARAYRYSALAEIARGVSLAASTSDSHHCVDEAIPTVAVAHHMDDQAETVLMNLMRGSGLHGLSGMPWTRTLDESEVEWNSDNARRQKVRLVRPLLGLRRSELQDYVDAFGLQYREDVSNSNTAFLRSRVRLEVLPALAEINPQIVDALARTAEVVRPEAERAESLNATALDSVTVEASPPIRYLLDVNRLQKLSLAEQRGTARLISERMGLDMREVGFDAVEQLVSRLRHNSASSAPQSLSGNIVWSVLSPHGDNRTFLSFHRRDDLPLKPIHPHLSQALPGTQLPCDIHCPARHSITPQWALTCHSMPREALPPNWRSHTDRWRAFLDADAVGRPVLREPADGLKFAPLGMDGHHKTLGDTFTDLKTPLTLRAQWPLVVDARDGSVLWICGYTISHNHRITESTSRVLVLKWVRHPEPERLATESADVTEPSWTVNSCAPPT